MALLQPTTLSSFIGNEQINAGNTTLISGGGKKMHIFTYGISTSNGLITLQDSLGNIIFGPAQSGGGSGNIAIPENVDLIINATEACTLKVNIVAAIDDDVEIVNGKVLRAITVNAETIELGRIPFSRSAFYDVQARLLSRSDSGKNYIGDIRIGRFLTSSTLFNNVQLPTVYEDGNFVVSKPRLLLTTTDSEIILSVLGIINERITHKVKLTISTN